MQKEDQSVVWTYALKEGYCAYVVAPKSTLVGRTIFLFLAGVLVLLLGLSDVQGQEQQPLPTDPSQLEKQFDERSLPSSNFTIRQQQDDAQPLDAADDIRFVLTSLRVDGVTALEEAELLPFYEDVLGVEISVARLFDIAGRMSAFYRSKGYILSRVIVPAQEVESGAVKLAAVEGYIHNISIEGDIALSTSMLAKLGRKITRSRPLLARDLERYMLLINDLPGISASAVLQASQEPGATDLTIVVAQKRAGMTITGNNRGSRFNGPVQGQLSAHVNSLFGMVSRTGTRVIGAAETSEFQLYELSHMHVLNTEGTTVQFIGRQTRSRPGGSFRDLDVRSDSKSARMVLQHPLVRSRARSFFVRGVLDVRDTKTDILGERFSEDRVRVARVGATLDFVDRLDGINLLDFEVSRGLDVWNATRTRSRTQSRADAETDFVKVAASATRLQRITRSVSLLMDAAGQFTKDGLVASEEFAIGGGQFGRAFDPSEIAGDRGLAGRIELRFDGQVNLQWIRKYQLYAFGDYGIVWNQSIDGGYQSVDLGSAGGGLRLTLNDNVSAYVEVAVPYKKTADFDARFGKSVRGFAGISFRF